MIEALSGRVRFRDKIRYIRSCPPGAGSMHVHRDVPGGPQACITVDAFLTPFTADNGATHIWPDSRFTAETTEHEHASVVERAEALPYVSIEGPAGSVSFRDERAWHRAGANRTGEPRVMLTIG